ncbi:MAG: PatB family C-S lyase [Candidatus Cloacimonetes bacterium]|nr:PatB family C-S lyase [Candidatus Cloacimonadota bacterium]
MNFDNKINRLGTDCYKWDGMQEKFGRTDLLPLWVADMDFPAADVIIDALAERVRHGVFGYTFRPETYYQSIINWHNQRHSSVIERSWILDLPGVVPGICLALQAIISSGDRVLIQTPVYDPFFQAVQDNGGELVVSPLKLVNNHYEIDFTDLEIKLANDVKVMLFCSPHNPVGRVWNLQELSRICELCVKNDVLLIADEIHSDLIFEPYRHIPAATISEEIKQRIIVLNAPSKTFNIAGLTTSYAVIPSEEIRRKVNEMIEKNHLILGNIFGNLALQTAYQQGAQWLDQLLIYLQNNYCFLRDYITREIPAVRVIRMEGTYLAWLDFREFGLNDSDLEKLLVDKAKIGLTPGIQYGQNGSGFMRLNFGCPRNILEQTLIRMKHALSQYAMNGSSL